MDPGSHEFWETCIDIVPGTLNPADMLTKCLASAEHRRYREVLGYQIRELNPVVSVIEFLGNESGVLMSITGGDWVLPPLWRSSWTCGSC